VVAVDGPSTLPIVSVPVALPSDLDDRIVTIDGPVAAGRSTLARSIAYEYGTHLLDTDLTLHAAAAALTRNPSLEPAVFAAQFVHQPGFGTRPAALTHPEDAQPDLWDGAFDDARRAVRADPAWCATFAYIHGVIIKDIRDAGDPMVVVGRDIAITLAPDAFAHVYLTAGYNTRSRRRETQFWGLPHRSTGVGLLTETDTAVRKHLRGLDRAILVDSTYCTRGDVVEIVVRHIGDVARASGGRR